MNQFSETKLLFSLLILQGLCATYFLWDAIIDLLLGDEYAGWADPQKFEFLVAIALAASLILTIFRLRQLKDRQKRMVDQLKVAAGLFNELIENHFEDWGLSIAECDVALLAIKGLSISDISRIRQSREGTIKAQLNAVYRKAGVSGRPQLLSLFIEELMSDGLKEQTIN